MVKLINKWKVKKYLIIINSIGIAISVVSEAVNQIWMQLPEEAKGNIPNAKYITMGLFALNLIAKMFTKRK